LHRQTEAELAAYHARVVEWNREQRARVRRGQTAATPREYLAFLGFEGG